MTREPDDSVTCLCLTTWPKRASMLPTAVAAYAWQTHPRCTLLIINDGAPLRSLRSDVRVLQVPAGLTVGAKRGIAVEAARTPWVATWDDDDLALPEHVGTLLAAARVGNAARATSRRVYLSDENLRVVEVSSYEAHAASVFRRDTALAAGSYAHVSYAEDGNLFMRMRMGGAKAAFVHMPTYVHRRHTGNVSRGHDSMDLDHRAADAAAARDRWPDPVCDAANARIAALLAQPRVKLVEPA